MPPKADAAPPKKVKEVPQELCGCKANTWRAPPKGKKIPPPIEHNEGCSFQRATCNRYPHLPRCVNCEEMCSYCNGINPWCVHCDEKKCKYMYKRDVLGFMKKSAPVKPPEFAAGGTPGAPGTAVAASR